MARSNVLGNILYPLELIDMRHGSASLPNDSWGREAPSSILLLPKTPLGFLRRLKRNRFKMSPRRQLPLPLQPSCQPCGHCYYRQCGCPRGSVFRYQVLRGTHVKTPTAPGQSPKGTGALGNIKRQTQGVIHCPCERALLFKL